jgi:glycosyltransferase involved in cell wall biosynthesis
MRKRKIKITVVSTTPVSGRPPKFIITLQKKYLVEFITRPGNQFLLTHLTKYKNIHIRQIGPDFSKKDVLSQINFIIQSIFLIFFSNSKIIYCFNLFSSPIGVFSKIFLNKKFICDATEFFGTEISINNTNNKLYEFIYYLKMIPILIADASTIAEPYPQNIPKYVKDKLILIYNFPSSKLFNYNIEPNNDFYKKYPLARNKKIIGYIGNVKYGLGLEKIIKAFSKIENNVILLIVGDILPSRNYKISKNYIEKYCDYYGVKNRVIITGYIEHTEYPSYCKVIDIGVIYLQPLSDFWVNYSLPIKLFEYIALGIPFVSTNFKTIKRFSNGCCLYVDPNNIKELIDAFNILLNDNILYTSLKRNCIKKSCLYVWEKQEKLIFNIIDYVIN